LNTTVPPFTVSVVSPARLAPLLNVTVPPVKDTFGVAVSNPVTVTDAPLNTKLPPPLNVAPVNAEVPPLNVIEVVAAA